MEEPNALPSALPDEPSEDEALDIDMAAEIDSEIFGQSTAAGAAWVQEAIRMRASFAQRLPGPADMTIGNGPGSLANLTAEQRKRKADEDADEWFDMMTDRAERQHKHRERERIEREQAEWDEDVHSFAGQDWTGKEWAQAAEDLKKGSKGYDWLVSYLMQKGQTREQAEQMAKDMELAARGMSKPPGQRTKEEQGAIDRVDKNPVARDAFENMEDAREADFKPVEAETRLIASTGRDASVSAGASGLYDDVRLPTSAPGLTEIRTADPVTQASLPATAADSTRSAAASGSVGGQLFASAPNLTEHHQAAVAAVEPLDGAKPAQVAAVPAPSSAAGLDI